MRHLLLLFLSGCATAGFYQTADTLGRGGWEAGGDLSGAMIVSAGSDDRPALLLPRGVVRYGVSDGVDLGLSVGLDGLRFGPKLQLTRLDAGPLIVSFAPGLRVLPLPRPSGGLGVMGGLEETLLVGYAFSDVTQLVATAHATQDLGVVENTAFLVWGGGSLGLSIQATPGLRIMPELGAMVPLVVVDADRSTGALGALMQVGVGVVAGKRTR